MENQPAVRVGGIEGEPTVKFSKHQVPKGLEQESPQASNPMRLAQKANSNHTTELDSEVLTLEEIRHRDQCEGVIAQGWETFLQVGQALATIRRHRLYRDRYATFDDYCRQKWEYSKTHANRLIEAAAVAAVLTPMGVKVKSESQLRPLVALPPQRIPVAWKRAEELAGTGEITAQIVRRAAEQFKTPLLRLSETTVGCKKFGANRTPLSPAFGLMDKAEKALKKHDSATVLAVLQKLRQFLKTSLGEARHPIRADASRQTPPPIEKSLHKKASLC